MQRQTLVTSHFIGSKEGAINWTDHDWVPVDRRMPTTEDGPLIAGGVKIAVRVLTVDMMLNGKNPETRGFHIQDRRFDDDDEGRQRVMFWASCEAHADLGIYAESITVQ